jgi:peptide/nickel transport system substrate-binding protein
MAASNYWERVTQERVGRRRLLQAGAAFSVGAASLALIGCGGDDSGGDDSASSDGAPTGGNPVKGGRLTLSNVGAGADSSLNVITMNRAGHILAAEHVYDHLMSTRVGEGSPYILEAATSAETPDDLTVVFKLKPNMKYQNIAPVNGRAVKASDIKAVHEYVKATAVANRSFQTTSMQSVEAPDDNTVVFKLQKPNAYLFTGTQLGEEANGSIIPVELIDKLDTAKSIGSGPYEELVNDLGVKAEYKRNEGFREAAKTYIDSRVMLLFGDAVAEESAFRSGQSDILQPPAGSPTTDDILKELGEKIYRQAYPTLAPFTINIGGSMEYNPFKKDIRSREAFYRAMDRQQYIDLVFNGKGTVPTGLLVDGLGDYKMDKKDTDAFFKQDKAAARQLLQAAGLLDREFEIMYFAPADLNAQSCQILQRQLSEVGLKTTIRGVPSSEGFDKSTKGEWHFFSGSHPAYASPQIIMRQQHTNSGSRFGFTGLGDPEIDALIEKSEAATDYQENVKLVKEVQLVSLKKYTGYVLLTSRTQEQLLYKKVRDWENDPSETWMPRYKAWIQA